MPSDECPQLNATGLDDKSALVKVTAWCRQATSHYLNQCWPSLMSLYGVIRLQWAKFQIRYPSFTINVILLYAVSCYTGSRYNDSLVAFKYHIRRLTVQFLCFGFLFPFLNFILFCFNFLRYSYITIASLVFLLKVPSNIICDILLSLYQGGNKLDFFIIRKTSKVLDRCVMFFDFLEILQMPR